MKLSKEELIALEQKAITIAAIKQADQELDANNTKAKIKNEVKNVKKLLGLKTHQELCNLLKQKYGFSLQTTAIARWITRGMIPSKYVDIFNDLVDDKLLQDKINKSKKNASINNAIPLKTNINNTNLPSISNLNFYYEDTLYLLKYITPKIEKELREKLLQIKNFYLSINKL